MSNLFEDNFENAFIPWSGKLESGATISPTNTIAHHGTWSALVSGLKDAGNFAWVYRGSVGHPDLYALWYVRMGSVPTASTIFFGRFVNSVAVANLSAGWTPATSKWGIYNNIVATSYAETGVTVPAANAWYGIKMRCYVHPTAGIAQLWVDNVLKVNQTGINTGIAANEQFQCGGYLVNNEPAERKIYLDCVKVNIADIDFEVVGAPTIYPTVSVVDGSSLPSTSSAIVLGDFGARVRMTRHTTAISPWIG